MASDSSRNNDGLEQASEKPSSKASSRRRDENNDEYLSEEDLTLKQQMELYVERVQDSDPGMQKLAHESMRQEICMSTKPLKFLRPHYGSLEACFANTVDSELKKYLADILSVLAITMSAEGGLKSLEYRLLGPLSEKDIGSWGHGYVRSLAGEIRHLYERDKLEHEEFIERYTLEKLIFLVMEIVAFHMKHNAETDAVDLLMEIGRVDLLARHVDSANYKRTCLYLTSAARYLSGRCNIVALDTVYSIYQKFEDYASALRIALFQDHAQNLKQVFISCHNLMQRKQLCYILARQGVTLELDDEMVPNDDDRKVLQDIINNVKLSEGYLALAQDIEVMEPKSPEDIYKVHLIDGWARAGASVDSTRQNLAATFVNAFVNAGFGQDKLMTVPSEFSSGSSAGSWLFKNKELGKTSAVASLGLILLWDVDAGLARIEKYFHSNDSQVIAGALLGVGIISCGIKNDCDPVLALLRKRIDNDREWAGVRIGAIMGLGLAYAGSQNEQIRSLLCPILYELHEVQPVDVLAFTALSLGLVFVGSCNEEIARSISYYLMNKSEIALSSPLIRFFPLGLSLLYLGKQDSVKATADVSNLRFPRKILNYCDLTLLSLAYAGTGDFSKVYFLLECCAQLPEKGETDTDRGPAVIGFALVAMAEEVGLDMAIRSIEHVLRYGGKDIQRAVPLALALLCISNPKVNVQNTLSRLSHDADSEVAMAAIISLGLIGAGTNNARIAGMLRNLSSYYYKEESLLFCVRIALGLIHLGKGLLTLAPYHSDRFLLSPTALAGIITMLHSCLDIKSVLLGEYHYVLYYLVLAMQPRMLMTVDKNLKQLAAPVHVGQAADVVGQAGQPRTITGFQTYSTPVLLAAGERAELATERYIPLSPVLEGFVILNENPEYREQQ